MEFKTVPDSGFHAVDSGFQSPGSRIPSSKFPRFQIEQAKKFPGFRIGFPCMARALSFRQIHLPSFSSQRSRTITREYSQIISTSRWAKKVELYTSSYVDLYLSGWQRPINTRDRGFDHSTCLILALLVLWS